MCLSYVECETDGDAEASPDVVKHPRSETARRKQAERQITPPRSDNTLAVRLRLCRKPSELPKRAVRVFAPKSTRGSKIMKIRLQTVYERLNKDRQIQLLKYILKVQGTQLRRLDFSAAAKALNASRAQIARDCQVLERTGLIVISNGELCLAEDTVCES